MCANFAKVGDSALEFSIYNQQLGNPGQAAVALFLGKDRYDQYVAGTLDPDIRARADEFKRKFATARLKYGEKAELNNPDTMRPFYRTGGMTNGGWSEHTDIKQVDTPGTPQDEWGTNFDPATLDNYIGFTDPEFGEITLSELRNKIPIPGEYKISS